MKAYSAYCRTFTYENSAFSSAKSALKRVELHISELKYLIERLSKKIAVELVTGSGSEQQLEVNCHVTKPVPQEISTTLGDAIHNLRVAFDYVAITLSTPPYGSGKPDIRLCFPSGIDWGHFVRVRDGYTSPNGTYVPGKMRGATPEALRIVEALEPYEGGRFDIRALHSLDALAKRMLIVPSISQITVLDVHVSLGGKQLEVAELKFVDPQDGRGLVSRLDAPLQSNVKLDLADFRAEGLEMVFAQGQPLSGRPILSCLLNYVETAKYLIKSCEKKF